MTSMLRFNKLVVALFVAALAGCATSSKSPPHQALDSAPARITVLYDAFGKDPALRKDWGFSALVEYGGRRILFDTGNDAQVFAHNVKAKGIDLTRLDFVVMSHRHGDHTSGLGVVLAANPNVPIYAPKENFGVFGAELPGTFYRRNESLPAEMRYFDGKGPDALHFGTPWPSGKFTWVAKTLEVAPGIHLVLLRGPWGVDLDVMEISLAIDTPEGIVLVVGCSHPTIEKIVEATRAATNRPIHLVLGGTHLLPAKASLHDTHKVAWIAPAHCTGEPAFAILKQTFGSQYVYAGLGTTLTLGREIQADSGASINASMDDQELALYRRLLALGADADLPLLAGRDAAAGPAP